MDWVTGVKLTTLPAEEVRALVGVGQEAFLVQLLEVGFFHGDPHPGNLLKVGRGTAGTYCGLLQGVTAWHWTCGMLACVQLPTLRQNVHAFCTHAGLNDM